MGLPDIELKLSCLQHSIFIIWVERLLAQHAFL